MQHPQIYKVIGLMSGTSGDGLDIAYCEFTFDSNWSFTIPHSTTCPFPESMAYALANSHLLTGEELRLLDINFGKWMGEEVKNFCEAKNVSPLAIASHGHTVFHRPDLKNTLQIGNGWSMHLASWLPVINDFRMLDVQLGGQGAPLVPIGDLYLFQDFDFCLNLGGIANISYQKANQRIAYDICPFNLILNHIAKKAGLLYDDGGQLARKGKVIPKLFDQLNDMAFYKKSGVKSLGREDIENDFLPLLEKQYGPIEDLLHTITLHCSYQISRAMEGVKNKRLIITGGGAYHEFFVEKLIETLKGSVDVILPENKIIDFKEALIFGFLGVLKIRGEVNCLSSVTGASRDNIGGVVYGEI
ncbi:anhydro-N-acetylmuramic acid kinase [soil metagenome]